MKCTLSLFALLFCKLSFGQNIQGRIINSTTKKAVEFANIGIMGKGVGTVSDEDGKFNFYVDAKHNSDTILFTMIGFKPLLVKVSDLRKNNANQLLLEEKINLLSEVVVKPKTYKEKTLGVATKSKMISAGFKDNILGYEMGTLMKVKKTAFLKKVNINIAFCSYDTVFYRLNIYKSLGKLAFENILTTPIYVKIPKSAIKEGFEVDLKSKNINIDGDFLVTLEHIKDLGKGELYFCAKLLLDKVYVRKTSHDNWRTEQVGVSISVVADVEK
ncbi:MAG: carboxypeptidase-like regulatory domain-containing protein [Bacteroidetes bacterium]|nr:carboxypeptidase-like regulatory domain-containing protein [Bacteroidota bacterium]